ncbi:hypothetical protein BKA81DRAFT_186787 [Phyllosticta paracitricarpa]
MRTLGERDEKDAAEPQAQGDWKGQGDSCVQTDGQAERRKVARRKRRRTREDQDGRRGKVSGENHPPIPIPPFPKTKQKKKKKKKKRKEKRDGRTRNKQEKREASKQAPRCPQASATRAISHSPAPTQHNQQPPPQRACTHTYVYTATLTTDDRYPARDCCDTTVPAEKSPQSTAHSPQPTAHIHDPQPTTHNPRPTRLPIRRQR